MEHAVLQQLPVAFHQFQQQQLQQFQHHQHLQQQRRSQQRQQAQAPPRNHALHVSNIQPSFHGLPATSQNGFYPQVTAVTPIQSSSTFIQTQASAVATVSPNLQVQPALSQAQGVAFPHTYGIATPQSSFTGSVPSSEPQLGLQTGTSSIHQPGSSRPTADSNFSSSNFDGLKLVSNPPDLQRWREKLFNVDELMVLTENEFQIYFPHVDNVYSHRSTQRYKAKPFVSHYFDCRLKGRPAGTPKSDDPNKKKRKRVARERDLCDVKIKITEFFAGSTREDIQGHLNLQPRSQDLRAEHILAKVNGRVVATTQASFDSAIGGAVANGESATAAIPATQRFYTVQRVNGTGAGGTRGDQIRPNHKHTLEESDRIKKNSVVRWMVKPKKRVPEKKTYHKKATGDALNTVKKHSKDDDLKLYGSCFCPFVQRVWISLEIKKIPYQYIEVDPYSKPKSLLDVNPRGLVPALKHGDWACHESTVLMEYLEDLHMGQPLLPPNPKTRAHSRLWSDHINRHIIPQFYRYLQEQDTAKQIEHAAEFKTQIAKLVEAAHPQGPFFLGPEISFVDVQIAPWMIRLKRVLKPYRGWQDAEPGSRWKAWLDAVEEHEAIRATTSGDDLYLDSYERYAENRPNTSQLANAVNLGKELP